jgi:trimeric autotransporter adhesin
VRRSSLLLVSSILSLSLVSGCSGGSNPNPSPSPSPTPPAPAVNPAPTISSVSPGSVVAGSSSQTLTFAGTGYIPSTAATLNGTALQTKYMSATSLQVVVPASALASGQVVSFVASNPFAGRRQLCSYELLNYEPDTHPCGPFTAECTSGHCSNGYSKRQRL